MLESTGVFDLGDFMADHFLYHFLQFACSAFRALVVEGWKGSPKAMALLTALEGWQYRKG